MSDILHRRPATNVGELDIHIGYVMDELAKILRRQEMLATKSDVADMRVEMRTFATKAEVDLLREEVKNNTVPHTLKQWSDVALRVAATAAAVAAIAALLSHFFLSTPK